MASAAAQPAEAPLSAAQRSKIRRLSQPKEPDPGEESGELNIVPYLDIITNILVFVLASVSVTFLTQLDTSPPAISGKTKQAENKEALNLTVLITDEGVAFKTSFGAIAQGCKGIGKGMTIPTLGGGKKDFDLEAIRACARQLKSQAGDGRFEEETQVTVTASRDIELKHLVAVLDALRSDEQSKLFPEFHLGVSK